MNNDEVTNNKGVFLYLIDGDERHLQMRTFDEKTKRKK